jgi:hypothetical protein
MVNNKKRLMRLFILLIIITSLYFGFTQFTWPSKTILCKDIIEYIPYTECISTGNRIEIINKAFKKGETSSSQIKAVIGKYLHTEYSTSYGHIEEYYLSIRPIDYIFNNFDSYRFGYDRNGVFITFSYDD